jgi:hypothetical protein
MLRDEPPPDDVTVLLRAGAATVAETLFDMMIDARFSAAVYDVERGAEREALFGISVFAQRAGSRVVDVLERFPSAPTYLITTVRVLRGLDFVVLATGSNPDHYDVQLVAGVDGASVERVTDEQIATAATRLVDAADNRPNPAYDA